MGLAPAIVLVAPQMGENIGAAARAMATCALHDLRLVAPRDGWPNPRAEAMGAGAKDILAQARVFADLTDALADRGKVYAATARPRDLAKPVMTPREAAAALHAAPASGPGPAILFGPERSGLETDAVALADVVVEVPLNPVFRSLNLAQAVMVVAYEWYQAMAPSALRADEGDVVPPARRDEIQGLFDQLEQALDEADFFRPVEKRPAMVRNLRTLLLRADLASHEVRALRGVVRALQTGRCPPTSNREMAKKRTESAPKRGEEAV